MYKKHERGYLVRRDLFGEWTPICPICYAPVITKDAYGRTYDNWRCTAAGLAHYWEWRLEKSRAYRQTMGLV